MKKLFYFCQFLAACMFMVYIFPSCAATITISGIDPTTDTLLLKDAQGNPASIFIVKGGKCVKWKIAKNSNVDFIVDLDKKDTSINVFRKLPHKKLWSKSWKGKVEKYEDLKEKFPEKVTPGGYIIEDYFITWKRKNSSDSAHVYDPRIPVKP